MAKTLIRYLAALLCSASLLLAAGATPAAASSGARDIDHFTAAFANVSPFIGAAGAIRGVNAAPLPWAVRSIEGELETNGQLDIDVDGLVLANDPAVPANLRGTNPVPSFAAVVSCLTAAGGTVV